MKSIKEINLKDKKVFLRSDLDVPIQNGQILEKFRIEKQKEAIDYLVEKGARVIIVSHISAVDSFGDLIPQLHIILGRELNFIKKTEDIQNYFDNYAGPALLENIRQFSGEVENDKMFAQNLSKNFDIYVNNAFAVCHRDHASVSAVAEYLPAYAGFLIEEEAANLKKVLDASAEGKTIIMGGAKASTKIPVIKNLINNADNVLVGGVVANDILKEKGVDILESIVDNNSTEILSGLDLNHPKLIIPEDYSIGENKILDIGDKTIENYKKIINEASTIIWNGPMGMFEKTGFEKGTEQIAKAISESKAYKIIGGGDTITAIDKFGLNGKFNFISTGGGAMLSFLAGEILPGLKALNYYG